MLQALQSYVSDTELRIPGEIQELDRIAKVKMNGNLDKTQNSLDLVEALRLACFGIEKWMKKARPARTTIEPFMQQLPTGYSTYKKGVRFCTFCESIATFKLTKHYSGYALLEYYCSVHIDKAKKRNVW